MYALKCPECGSPDLSNCLERAECHCRNCGLVVADGLPGTAKQENLSHNSLSGTQFVDGKVIKAIWLLSSKEKNIYRAKRKLSMLVSRIKLPKYIQEQAFYMYKKAVHNNLCVGRDNNSILYACVYAVCNLNEIPKTAAEITEYTFVDNKHLLKAYSLLQKELGVRMQFYDPIDLLPRFISHLKLSHKTLAKAVQIMEKIKGTSIYSGKNPKSIASAAIYIAAKLNKEKIGQRDIANQIGIMEVTIRKRYKEIVKLLKISI